MPVDARREKTRLGSVPPHALEKKKISLSAATMMTFVVCASKGTTKKKKKAKCQGAGGSAALCVGVAH